jgi:sugar/nucleoside kinase (ribokinase family)
MTAPVLVIGSMALDDLLLPSGEFRDVVGGAATFASVAASLFAPARVVAVVGRDFPEPALERLAHRNIDISGIARPEGKTFKWVGRYAENLASRETLDTQLNVFADFRPVLPPTFRQSRFALLGNIHPALQLEVLDQLDPGAFVAADTMNFWIHGERALLGKLLKRVNCLIINDEELRELSGVHNLRRAAQAVLAMGPERLIVKKGEHGAFLFDGPSLTFVPAYPLENEVDPTGAGDSFAGALLGRLAELGKSDSASLRDALQFATTVASFCVEGVGLDRLIAIDRSQVMARMAELRELTNYLAG